MRRQSPAAGGWPTSPPAVAPCWISAAPVRPAVAGMIACGPAVQHRDLTAYANDPKVEEFLAKVDAAMSSGDVNSPALLAFQTAMKNQAPPLLTEISGRIPPGSSLADTKA